MIIPSTERQRAHEILTSLGFMLCAANSGEFVVYDPDGIEIGRVAVAATFNNQIKFVIADGSNDFAIGDAFSVTVDGAKATVLAEGGV